MDIYYSYWSAGRKDGWRSDEVKNAPPFFNIMERSVFLVKKIYPESKFFFITDKDGLELAQKNKIKFNQIYDILEDLPKEYHETWSLGKLKAYNWIAKKKQKFIHIDHDVFITNRFPEYLLNSSIFAQSEDTDRRDISRPYIPYNFNVFKNKIKNFYIVKDHNFIHTYNCGIFGGTNFNLIEEYSSSAMRMVLDKENEDLFLKSSENQSLYYSDKACIAEQYYLTGFCYNKGIYLNTLIKDYNSWQIENYRDLILRKYGYIHLVGWMKELTDEYFEKCLQTIDYRTADNLWPPQK